MLDILGLEVKKVCTCTCMYTYIMCVRGVQQLAVPCRRLVCYCRLCEVADITKKESLDRHQREMFLFNDILLVTCQLFTYCTAVTKRIIYVCACLSQVPLFGMLFRTTLDI